MSATQRCAVWPDPRSGFTTDLGSWLALRATEPSSPAVLSLCPSTSSRCWALDGRVCDARRRGRIHHLRQQFVVCHRSSSGRPRVFRLQSRNCCHEPGPHCSQGLLLLLQHKDSHRLPDPHHQLFQRSGLSTWLSLHLNLVSSLFYQQNLQHLCSVDSCTHRHSWQHNGRLGGQAGLHSSSDLGSEPPGNGNGSDSEEGSGGVSCMLLMQSTLSRISHSYWRDQPAVSLEIWLDQKPVCYCRPAENRPLTASGQLPSPHRMTTLSDVSLLRRRLSIFFFAARRTHRHGRHLQLRQLHRSLTHVVLSGVDQGRDSLPWPLPLSTGNEIEVKVWKLRKWPISKAISFANMHVIERLTVNYDTPKIISEL